MNLKRNGYKAKLDWDSNSQLWSGYIKGHPDMEIYASSKDEAEAEFIMLVDQLENGFYD